jgi:aromatic-L-amino-acid/L-tryptophan decarboxylase
MSLRQVWRERERADTIGIAIWRAMPSLDPSDWSELRSLGHRMLDDMFDHIATLRDRPVWQEPPPRPNVTLPPVALNIVCFRYLAEGADLDRLNADIVADVQESGTAAPSTTMIGGRWAIRAAIVNHRTEVVDTERLVDAVLAAGRSRSARAA